MLSPDLICHAEKQDFLHNAGRDVFKKILYIS